MTRIDTSSSLRAMVGAPVVLPVAVRFRVTVANWVRGPYPQAIAVYLAVRLVSVVVLAIMATNNHQKLLDRLTAWDGQWYLKLAEFGYHGVSVSSYAADAAGHPYAEAPMAFFPLYPGLVSLLARLPGINTVRAALLVSLLAGIAAACGVLRIGRFLDPTRLRTGLILVALWAGAPMAITLTMTYTEALFTAFAAWALVGVLERRWWLAGICSMFAGLTRSTAGVLIVIVVVAALAAAFRDRDRWPALACAVMAPLGLTGYWASVAARTGSLTGWQDIEWRGWNTRFDFGHESVEWVIQILLGKGSVMETTTVMIVLGAITLAALGARRMPWPLAAYGIGVVVLIVGTCGLPFAKARFLLAGMIVLLIPIALGLANRKPKTAIVTVTALVLVGSWFSAHSLTGWQYAI
jgi:hypothetical protein